MDFNPERPVFIQDTVHIGTKLKTRLLKPNILLPMGNFTVSVSHIEILIDSFSKDKHFLCKSLLESEVFSVYISYFLNGHIIIF